MFLPYCVYMIVTLYYFLNYVPREWTMEDKEADYLAYISVAIITVLSGYFLFKELMQVKFFRLQYFMDPWNWGNNISILLNLTIVCVHLFSEERFYQLTNITSVASVLLWGMFFYWMRLFSQTAFYFMVIFMFTSVQVILDSWYINRNVNQPEDYASIVDEDLTDNYIVTAVFT